MPVDPFPNPANEESDMDIEDVKLLVRLGIDGGGRVDPDCILRRPPGSTSRAAFMEAQDAGWLDGSGYVTPLGRVACR